MTTIAERGAAYLKSMCGRMGKSVENSEKIVCAIGPKVALSHTDITKLRVDAIVNAANETLLGGGGVDGAIHKAAGPRLLEECRMLGGCREGDAKITAGYNLPSKHVIHTVGPQSEKPDVLSDCYLNSLQLMEQNNLRSIAFPCIATGVYGYDNEKAANIALWTTRKFIQDRMATGKDPVDKVIFDLFNQKDIAIYKALFPIYFPTASTTFENP
ncbi:hypothetical protein CLU79DRAFT_838021 [Phycomyces nitens]|nr:hypothetical protein CLU79DRAFT_838021 [Phycomyces nitens]